MWGLLASDPTHIRYSANVHSVQSPNPLPLSPSTLGGPLCQCPRTASILQILPEVGSLQLPEAFCSGSWKASLIWHRCVPRWHQVWRGQEEKTQAFPGRWQFSSGDSSVCPKKNSRTLQDTSPSRTGVGSNGGMAGSLFLPQLRLSPSQEGAELNPRPSVLNKGGQASPGSWCSQTWLLVFSFSLLLSPLLSGCPPQTLNHPGVS